MKGNFHNLINSNIPVLIDFHAEWCQPCKVQSPILQDIARELNERLKVIKVDVDKNQELANKYQIQSVPTIMIFRDGQVIFRKSGLISKNNLLLAILENS